MREYSGWLQPEKYTDPQQEADNALRSVGVSDISPLEKLDIKGGEIASCLRSVLGSSGLSESPGAVASAPTSADGFEYVCRLTLDHALAVGRANRHAPVTSPLEASGITPPEGCYVTNVTSVLAGLNLLGPSAPNLLSELTQLDLSGPRSHERWCAECGLAKVRAVIVKSNVSQSGRTVASFDLFFGRDHAEYVWNAIIWAGAKYSIAPFGVEAHRRLHGARGSVG